MAQSYKHIKPVTFSAESHGPHLLILAGIHGDEYEPILAVQRLIDAFGQNNSLEKGQITLVAVVNEPAHELDARCGPDGLDLARTCPGDEKGTATEQIAREVSDLISTADYLIDMHTGGKRYEIYPLSGYVLHPDSDVLNAQRKMCRAFGLPVQWGTSPHLDGRTLSVARDVGVPAIYTEYGGGSTASPDIARTLFQGCLRVMAALDLISDSGMVPSEPLYIVEDHREESGHLQILYPAPVGGIISHRVDLGDVVTKGQTISAVRDRGTGKFIDITSREDGMVFLLNRQQEVSVRISTAGILPITQPGRISIT